MRKEDYNDNNKKSPILKRTKLMGIERAKKKRRDKASGTITNTHPQQLCNTYLKTLSHFISLLCSLSLFVNMCMLVCVRETKSE